MTNAGIYGTVKSLSKDGTEVSLEIADKTVIRLRKEYVGTKLN